MDFIVVDLLFLLKGKNMKVKLNLVDVDGNAFSVMGKFSQAAKRQGFSQAEIDEVLDEAMSGDYNHLLATIQKHCE